MAVVGMLGGVMFSVSDRQVQTFNNMQWDSSVQYATHNIHLKEPLLEFVGIETSRITFSMYISSFLGINPLRELERLDAAKNRGDIMRLVVGSRVYGKKWVVQRTQKSLEKFDGRGVLLAARVNVTLLAYAERGAMR